MKNKTRRDVTYSVSTIIMLFFLAGCTPKIIKTETTEIRDKIYKIQPPVVNDSGHATKKTDTLIQIVQIIKNDTLVDIQYLPAKEIFKWKIKPDMLFFPVTDTLRKTEYIEKINKIEAPFTQKLGIGFIGAIIGILLLLAFYFFIYQKQKI